MRFNPDLLAFDEPSHVYRYDGQKIPSVTQIISASGSGVDYSSIPKRILERAAEIGTNVHKSVENFHKDGNGLRTTDASAKEYLIGYRQFLDDAVFTIFESERKLACPKYWFAGTVDLTGWVNGELSVIDIKTTSKLHHDTVELQLAAYQYLASQYYAEEIPKRFALHLKNKGSRRYVLEPLNRNPGARYQFLEMATEYNGSN